MPDPMQFAIALVEGVTGETLVERPAEPAKPEKSPAAVARGERGGQVRALKVPAERRKEIARKAASTRWKRIKKPT